MFLWHLEAFPNDSSYGSFSVSVFLLLIIYEEEYREV